TIPVQGGLPPITEALTIDGYTQPGASVNTLATGDNAVLRILLSGSLGDIITINAGATAIRGLALGGTSGVGIQINADGNLIEGNFIGILADGTTPFPDESGGIYINGGANNTIGGATPAARNLIGANQSFGGIHLYNGAANNTIVGNYLGTD